MTEASLTKKIVILGGGTAGWMAANLFAIRWPQAKVRLVESSDIGIIGVGEGSTPQMKLFFDAIDVQEAEWMPECNATYKVGIQFNKWSQVPGFEQYFHPFPSQTDGFTTPVFFKNVQQRIQGDPASAHPDAYFLASYLAKQGKGPMPAESFPFDVAYGYHFDSGLLGQFLAKKAATRGVERVIGTVQQVSLNDAGEIGSIILESGQQIAADFFIDCTGFSSLLLQQTLAVPFKSFKENLFNDAAVVAPTAITPEVKAETQSTALNAGWVWKIPLRNRYGNGYVYSSSYLSADEAETEFRDHLGLLDADTPVKHLKMKVGRVEQHWAKNCLGVGLSQGFIEPLEATALYLVFETIYRFMKYYEMGQFSAHYAEQFNAEINQKFDGVRDYIVCHYKVNQRRDTDYWRDNANNENLSDGLRQVLDLWVRGGDFVREMHRRGLEGSYQSESWACLLAGYGIFPPIKNTGGETKMVARHDLDKLADFIRRCGLNFAPHKDQLI